eukprot:CAMPEP_0176326490 /NCGR_PEP_ID=MMETSP0121_2-20121125/73952_1 /TAXON_ID=160619 /ORGANISM="Kryptoperidinium foliaceum, Strain CCMP 1326" /LENGTH=96 /DNA_ID=CAMNT_0017669087 /DNA_START=432 /DNA_END=718 /DNA_ORIENTATION=-
MDAGTSFRGESPGNNPHWDVKHAAAAATSSSSAPALETTTSLRTATRWATHQLPSRGRCAGLRAATPTSPPSAPASATTTSPRTGMRSATAPRPPG